MTLLIVFPGNSLPHIRQQWNGMNCRIVHYYCNQQWDETKYLKNKNYSTIQFNHSIVQSLATSAPNKKIFSVASGVFYPPCIRAFCVRRLLAESFGGPPDAHQANKKT